MASKPPPIGTGFPSKKAYIDSISHRLYPGVAVRMRNSVWNAAWMLGIGKELVVHAKHHAVKKDWSADYSYATAVDCPGYGRAAVFTDTLEIIEPAHDESKEWFS